METNKKFLATMSYGKTLARYGKVFTIFFRKYRHLSLSTQLLIHKVTSS